MQTGDSLKALLSLDRISRIYQYNIDAVNALHRVYGDDVEEAVKALGVPGNRYFFKVNTLKSSISLALAELNAENVEAQIYDKVPESLYCHVRGPSEIQLFEKRIVVDKFTAESLLQGAHVYAPGIMKCQGLKRGDRVTVLSVNGSPVASGIARMNEREILALRRGLAIEITNAIYMVPSLRETMAFSKGIIYPQSLPAMVTSLNLQPRRGETVVDIGASPGGKTSHLAALMMNEGRILAIDRNEDKLAKLADNLRRLGVLNATLLRMDGRYVDKELSSVVADRVSVDVSCTSMGVRPKLFEDTTAADIAALSAYQKQFLKPAAKILRKDGLLSYTTCTLTIDENEAVADYAVRECGLEPADQMLRIGAGVIPFGTISHDDAQRFHPHIHDGPGYFIALFRKKREPAG